MAESVRSAGWRKEFVDSKQQEKTQAKAKLRNAFDTAIAKLMARYPNASEAKVRALLARNAKELKDAKAAMTQTAAMLQALLQQMLGIRNIR